MIFLDSINSEFFEEENLENNQGDSLSLPLKPHTFIETLKVLPDYEYDVFDPPLKDSHLDIMIDYFKNLNENSSESLNDNYNSVLTKNSSDNSLSIFNSFKALNKSFTKFFNRVDHIRLNRYV